MGKSKTYQEAFYFNKKERIGLLVLGTLIICTAVWQRVAPSVRQEAIPIRWEVLPMEEQNETIKEVRLANFDPNIVQLETLLAMGVSERAAKNWTRYLAKGGRFKKAQEVERIFGLSPSTYQQLLPYIKIAQTPPSFKKQQEKKKFTTFAKNEQASNLFSFNPNEASVETLLDLGLSLQTAQQIQRFREKGGQFRKPEDLGKIYSLPPEQYERLYPYIDIPATKKPQAQKEYARISLNHAGQQEWESLPGIGPGYTRRILDFREKLGGFHSPAQLYEVWGLPDSVVQVILPFIIPDGEVQQLSASHASKEVLMAHPYLNAKQVQLILRFREAHEGQISWADIQGLPLFDEEQLQRLAPYIMEAQWP